MTSQTLPETFTSEYFKRDKTIIDYDAVYNEEANFTFRGPWPDRLEPGGYFTCLGAAQTFGCFCKAPYPALLSQRLEIPGLNCGVGGAGASFFVRKERLIDITNRGSFAILQVMSARSEDTSAFLTNGLETHQRRTDGRIMTADDAYDSLLSDEALATMSIAGRRLFLFRHRPSLAPAIVKEARAAMVQAHLDLLARLTVPTVLLYFSKRPPRYRARFYRVHALLGDYPQLVTDGMVDQIRSVADAFVSCVSRRGLPQILRDETTGRPTSIDMVDGKGLHQGRWKRNLYYPTPEMHEDAAAALEPLCQDLLSPQSR